MRLTRVFFVLVVPVLLMLGSIYVHTAAARLAGEADRLQEEKAQAEDEGGRLEVRITNLSESGEIRESARKDLGMRDPGSQDLWTYDDGSYGEDAANGGGEKEKNIEERTGE